MERSTIFKFGKPSISMGHGFHGYVSHNQRVNMLNPTGTFFKPLDYHCPFVIVYHGKELRRSMAIEMESLKASQESEMVLWRFSRIFFPW